MLEKMDEFFNNRIDGYEEHQLTAIAGAEEFYPFTASCLPATEGANILDLGCGTGLELNYYLKIHPAAKITCIDLAEDMLKVLKEKFADHDLTVIHGSYFEVPFQKAYYDAAVSVESLHHFTMEEKISLYQKVRNALKAGGYFILTDYFASSEEEETRLRQELKRLRSEQQMEDGVFYHYDTPLTIVHEIQALKEAGFSAAEVLGNWSSTYTIKAGK